MKYVLDGMIWPEGDYVFHRRICTPTLLVHGLRDNKVSLMQECHMERVSASLIIITIRLVPMRKLDLVGCPFLLFHLFLLKDIKLSYSEFFRQ